METALKEMASSGTLGAIVAAVFSLLALVIAVLIWTLKRYVDSSMRREEKFEKFMEALTSAMNAIGINCQACRVDSMARLHEAGETIGREISLALAAQATRFESALTNTAQSIRGFNEQLVQNVERIHLRETVDELSRPHTAAEGIVRR